MVESKKRKALYEVIDRTKSKSHQESIPSDSGIVNVDPVFSEDGNAEPLKEQRVRWSTRPRLLQFTDAGFDISISYPLAIAIFLGFVLVIAAVFKMGLTVGNKTVKPDNIISQTEPPIRETVKAVKIIDAENVENKTVENKTAENESVKSSLNRIVIQQLDNSKNLEPVKAFFANFGIKTQIKQLNNTYYLVTEDKYENPAKSGTDGFAAKEKIVRIGAGYKPPEGFAGFGPNPFVTAYGMKFDD